MKNRFNYLIDKIKKTELESHPFKFLYIKDFLNLDDFNEIQSLDVINVRGDDFDNLYNNLTQLEYKHQPHPGTFQNINKYIQWRDKRNHNNSDIQGTRGAELVEAGGFALRLEKLPKIIQDLVDILCSKEMENAFREKFNLDDEELRNDSGLHKYFTGYEISPHPDTREKALTYMLNLNPDPDSHNKDYHTRFLKFKEAYKYVSSVWNSNPEIQRPWVPWSWCETEVIQTANNSITIFSPNNHSLHAVKANYDDLEYQRTQIYGNYWYKSIKAPLNATTYNDFDFKSKVISNQKKYDSLSQKIYRTVRNKINSLKV